LRKKKGLKNCVHLTTFLNAGPCDLGARFG